MRAEQVEATNAATRALGGGDFDALLDATTTAFEALGLPAPAVRTPAVNAHRGLTFSPQLGDAVSVHLERPGVSRGALLCVDRALADAILSQLLGGDGVSAAHDAWDYGVFVYVVTQVLSEVTTVGAPAFVAGVEPRPREWLVDQLTGPGTIAEFAFETRWGGKLGWVRLFLPTEILRAAESVLSCRSFAAKAVADVVSLLPLSVGRVSLSGTELRSLRPGDAVLLTEHGLSAEGFEATGENAVRIWLSDESWIEARLAESSDWTAEVVSTTLHRNEGAQMTSGTDSAETTQMVGQTDVNVEAVVGRVELTLDALARLSPGQVLPTEQRVGDPVELMANGTLVARGELVDVEGRLGVRILSMQPRQSRD